MVVQSDAKLYDDPPRRLAARAAGGSVLRPPLIAVAALMTSRSSTTVPATGTYRILVNGAAGSTLGAWLGARVQGDFLLTEGTVLKILVGHLWRTYVWGEPYDLALATEEADEGAEPGLVRDVADD